MSVNFSCKYPFDANYLAGETFARQLFDVFRSDSLKMRGSDEEGLLELERLMNCSMVCKLWHDFAMQISLKVKVQASRWVPIAEYTCRTGDPGPTRARRGWSTPSSLG